MGFDYARTENEAERIGSATGIVNVGGFVASLLTIALIGVILSLRSGGGPSSYTLGDFRLAFAVQYLFWTVGLIGVLYNRRRLRAARGLELDRSPTPSYGGGAGAQCARADRSAGQPDAQPLYPAGGAGGCCMTVNELSRWTSTLLPSDLVTVTS